MPHNMFKYPLQHHTTRLLAAAIRLAQTKAPTWATQTSCTVWGDTNPTVVHAVQAPMGFRCHPGLLPWASQQAASLHPCPNMAYVPTLLKKWGWKASGAFSWLPSAYTPPLPAHAPLPAKRASVTLLMRMLPWMVWYPCTWSHGFFSAAPLRAGSSTIMHAQKPFPEGASHWAYAVTL
jgi:hypothetical protein